MIDMDVPQIGVDGFVVEPCKFAVSVTLRQFGRTQPIRARKMEGRERVGSNSCPGEDEAP